MSVDEEELTSNVFNIVVSLMNYSINRTPMIPTTRYNEANIIDLIDNEVGSTNRLLPPTPTSTPVLISDRTSRTILQRSLEDKPKYKKVISKEGEKCLKNAAYHPEEYEQKTCPITQDDFKEGDTITELPCGHIFDKDAIEHWLKNEKAECPVCRLKLEHHEVVADGESHNEDDIDNLDDLDEYVYSRMMLIESLSRIARTPLVSYDHNHPFGPRSDTDPLMLNWLSTR